MKNLAFDLLAKAALADLTERLEQCRTLEHERLLLSRKLKELDSAQVTLDRRRKNRPQALDAVKMGLTEERRHHQAAAPQAAQARAGTEAGPAAPSVELRRAEIEAELGALHADTDTLDARLDTVIEALNAASASLVLEAFSFILDHKNIKHAKPNGRSIQAVEYQILHDDTYHVVVMPVKFLRSAIKPRKNMLQEAARYLS